MMYYDQNLIISLLTVPSLNINGGRIRGQKKGDSDEEFPFPDISHHHSTFPE